jgi:hypothetical protein
VDDDVHDRSRGRQAQLHAGELGVVMHVGRPLVMAGDIVLQTRAISPEAVALLVDPRAPGEDDGV